MPVTAHISKNALPIIALLLVQLIFGFNYAASKIIVNQFPPILWGAIRMGVAAILMFVWAYFSVPKSERVVDQKFLYPLFLYALVGIALNQSFFLLGLKYTTTTNSAILNTLIPIFTLGFSILFKSEKLTFYRGMGFLMAAIGVLILRNVETLEVSFDTLRGDIYTLLNGASLALFFTMSRDFLKKYSVIWSTAWLFLWGSILLALVALADLSSFEPILWTDELKIAIVYNIIGATMITYFLNSWTLTKVSASSVALFIYLQPLVAVVNGWLMFDEVPTARTGMAMGCIFIGVFLGVMKKL
jgi:drug/metabolite transporter (DMT)-like permease